MLVINVVKLKFDEESFKLIEQRSKKYFYTIKYSLEKRGNFLYENCDISLVAEATHTLTDVQNTYWHWKAPLDQTKYY